jgi:multicomponent K+:H+ antiporter subunit F
MNALPTTTLAAAGERAAIASSSGPLTPAEHIAQGALFLTVEIGLVAIGVAFALCMWRLLKGPSLADRGLASDVLTMQVVGLAILLTIRLRSLMFFDAVLIVSLLGFASTIAFAQFIGRRRAV